jgi:hypothetical protein
MWDLQFLFSTLPGAGFVQEGKTGSSRFWREPGASFESGATHNVCGVESLGALLAFELHRIALVQGLVSIFLDSGEVYENILSS